MAAKTIVSVRYPPSVLERADELAKRRNEQRTEDEKGRKASRTTILIEALEIGLDLLEKPTMPAGGAP